MGIEMEVDKSFQISECHRDIYSQGGFWEGSGEQEGSEYLHDLGYGEDLS